MFSNNPTLPTSKERTQMTKTKNIYSKLSDVQNEIGVLSKNANNPFYHSQYLTLDKIVSNLLPLMQKHGLCLYQVSTKEGLQTVLADIDTGDKIESLIPYTSEDINAQGRGSEITYYRRYGLSALCQIITEEDDDGNRAVMITEKQIKLLLHHIYRTGTSKEKLLAFYKVKALEELTSKQASSVIAKLAKRPTIEKEQEPNPEDILNTLTADKLEAKGETIL